MSEQAQLPPVLPPSDHESLKAPRTMLGIAIIGLFATTVLLPYFIQVPSGPATNLILTTAETVKNIVILVMGYYFGTSQGSTRKDEVIASQVAPPSATPVVVQAPATRAAADITLQPGETVKVDAAPERSLEDPA